MFFLMASVLYLNRTNNASPVTRALEADKVTGTTTGPR